MAAKVLHGTLLPSKLPLYIALQRINGIGKFQALRVCASAGLFPTYKPDKCTPRELDKIDRCITRYGMVKAHLTEYVRKQISRHVDIGTYRGLRYVRYMPVRGQRTSTNAKTSRRVIPLIRGTVEVKRFPYNPRNRRGNQQRGKPQRGNQQRGKPQQPKQQGKNKNKK